jgi:hypothetical protein
VHHRFCAKKINFVAFPTRTLRDARPFHNQHLFFTAIVDLQDDDMTGWAEEISSDVEWAHAIAPGANIRWSSPNTGGAAGGETTVSAKLHCRGETTLANLSGILRQLKKERDRVQQQLSGLNAALEAFAGVYRNGSQPRRKMSSKGRARIAAAQRARWAKVKGQKVVPIKTGKRTMSASARRKIAAAQRARWAKVRAAKK